MFGGLGTMEIVLIFLIALLVFGAKRLPEIGSSLGKGIREFKGSIREIEREISLPPDDPKPPVAASGESGDDGEPRRLTTSA